MMYSVLLCKGFVLDRLGWYRLEKYQCERHRNGTGTKNENSSRTKNENGTGTKKENGTRTKNENGARTKNQGTVPGTKNSAQCPRVLIVGLVKRYCKHIDGAVKQNIIIKNDIKLQKIEIYIYE